MIRKILFRDRGGTAEDFRWRSVESSRLEELTDAVIGFALTLLVVSLEVPRTFDDLLVTVRDFPGFAVSFGILIIIWHEHYKFFRRYALQNQTIVVLNAILLFLIVFYMYPLKFLFTLSFKSIMGGGLFVTVPGSEPVPMIRDEQLPVLIILFGVGWIALWLVFALMYWHALQKREVLRLNELEVFNTQVSVLENLAGVGVGLISILVAFFGSSPGSFSTSTWIYLLMFPLTWIIRKNGQKRKRALQNRLVEDMLDPSEPE